MSFNVQTFEQQINGRVLFATPGNTFRLIDSDAPVSVELLQLGAVVGRADNFPAGLAVEGAEFDALAITSAAAQTVKWIVADRGVRFDRFSGDVVATISQGSVLADAVAAVGVAAAVVLAANTGRKRIVFHAPAANTGPVYLGGAGVTVAGAAIVLQPGDSYIEESAAAAPWSAIAAAAQSLNINTAT